MKILLAPSEAKSSGGDQPPIDRTCFIFPELYEKRLEILTIYQEIINQKEMDQLKALFGIKKEAQIESYIQDIFTLPTQKAIMRYTGVAFEHLAYTALSKEAQNYIDHNVLLFSNLFGIVRADDLLPEYKLKQGAKLASLNIEKHYKTSFSDAIDAYLENETIIDLRAGFYEKFYTIKKPHVTLKFLKEGKVVSHWAKAYRGKVLALMAKHQVSNVTELEEVINTDMTILEKIETKNKTTWVIETSQEIC